MFWAVSGLLLRPDKFNIKYRTAIGYYAFKMFVIEIEIN